LRIKLRSDLKYNYTETTLKVAVPLRGVFTLYGVTREDFDIFKRLSLGFDVNEISILKYKPIFRVLENAQLINTNVNFGGLNSIDTRTLEWLNHYVTDPVSKLQYLRQQKIAILGCGGLGSEIYLNLLRIGFRNFFILDSSTVDLPDLNRQAIYRRADIGKEKVEVCSDFAKSEFKDVTISTSTVKITNEFDLSSILNHENPDFIYSCIDEPVGLAKYIVTKASINIKSPVIFGEVGLNDAVIGPLLKNSYDKSDYAWFLNNSSLCAELNSICEGSLSFTNSIAANLQAWLGFTHLLDIDIITNLGQYNVDFYDLSVSWENLNITAVRDLQLNRLPFILE
jgi:hypothetical protein